MQKVEEGIKFSQSNGNQPKFDLRDWDAAHEKMGKGLTLSNDEVKALKIALENVNL